LPPSVINQLSYEEGVQVVITIDPTLAALGLPPYPSLPANTEAGKIEEIRRTVYVGNLPKNLNKDQLCEFFSAYIGEVSICERTSVECVSACAQVMYIRMAGSDLLPCRYGYVEFSNQSSVPIALQNDGIDYFGSRLRWVHAYT
jgi:arginine/serine-rich splicing factor 12